MAKRKVSFIATKYKNKPVNVRFYTKSGKIVKFLAKHKTPVKIVVKFKARTK